VLCNVELNQLSIITATYNHRDYITPLYNSLLEHCGQVDWEWLVGDTGDDDTSAYLNSLCDNRVRCYRLPNNSFAETNNVLAGHARSVNLLFLNNDARVLPGFWEQPLHLLELPKVGIVGSVILNEDSSIQSAGMALTSEAPYSYNLLTPPSKEHGPLIIPAVTGACLFCRASLFRSLGGFDPSYLGGYYEDTDLCLRVYAAGHMILLAPKSRVIHKSRGSLDVSCHFWRNIPRNQRLFKERWGLVIRRLSPISHLPFKSSVHHHSALCLNPWLSTLGGGEYEFTWAVNFLSQYCSSVTVSGASSSINRDLAARFEMTFPSSVTLGGSAVRDHTIIWDQTYYDLTTDFSTADRLHLKRVMFGPTRVKLPTGPRYLFNSEYTQRSLRRTRQGTVIYPPVGNAPAITGELAHQKRECIIVNVGRFAKRRRYLNWKNQEAVIRFFHSWPQNSKFTLLLAGNVNDDDYLSFCTELAQNGGTTANIMFCPGIPRSDLMGWLNRSMFFVTFSGYGGTTAAQSEHFGIALVEAMAAGCVCFAYAAGGHTEIIEHGVDGFLWNTERELAQILTHLSTEGKAEARAVIGGRARQKAIQFAPMFAELQVRQVMYDWERNE
jgi:GT2 family glycosyltransferase